MIDSTRQAVAIMGATATGKSDLALRLAEKFPAEIVSMDSRQVYRGFDVGTGKVSLEDRRRIPHHLIDILDPSEKSTAGGHQALARNALEQIEARRKRALFVGGTGLYFRVLFRGIIDARIPQGEAARFRMTIASNSTPGERHRCRSGIGCGSYGPWRSAYSPDSRTPRTSPRRKCVSRGAASRSC
jgi:tRNA dimethylallyltransferase